MNLALLPFIGGLPFPEQKQRGSGWGRRKKEGLGGEEEGLDVQ